jgi:hypothetical protein
MEMEPKMAIRSIRKNASFMMGIVVLSRRLAGLCKEGRMEEKEGSRETEYIAESKFASAHFERDER